MNTEPKFGEWIDATTRRPDKSGTYLVTVLDKFGSRYTSTGWFGNHDNKGLEWSWGGIKIIAWMPMPEPAPRPDPFEEWFATTFFCADDRVPAGSARHAALAYAKKNNLK